MAALWRCSASSVFCQMDCKTFVELFWLTTTCIKTMINICYQRENLSKKSWKVWRIKMRPILRSYTRNRVEVEKRNAHKRCFIIRSAPNMPIIFMSISFHTMIGFLRYVISLQKCPRKRGLKDPETRLSNLRWSLQIEEESHIQKRSSCFLPSDYIEWFLKPAIAKSENRMNW